jgi:hypothetical protein
LEHFWPDIAALPIDAIRNATAGALIIGQRPRANVPAASAISEQASIVRERGGGGAVSVSVSVSVSVPVVGRRGWGSRRSKLKPA